jgi:hypothetical protein
LIKHFYPKVMAGTGGRQSLFLPVGQWWA